MFAILESIGNFFTTIANFIIFLFQALVNGIGLVSTSISNSILLVGFVPPFIGACIVAFFIIAILRIVIELL